MSDQKYMDAFDHDVTKRKADFLHKVAQVRSLMQELKHDAVVLSLSANFAWITSGARSYVFMATEGGAGSIYVDATQVAVLTNEIEGHKLVNEEMRGLEEVVILVQDPWYAQRSHADVAKELSKSDKIAVDATNSALSGRLLSCAYIDRVRDGGLPCSWQRLRRVIGQVARAMWAQGITPVVMLVAADERVDNIRHPLPTKKRVKNKAMLVICGQRAGLIASTTRLVYITTTPNATMPEDLVRRHEAATYVDAAHRQHARYWCKAGICSSSTRCVR
ncbi:Creatinase/Aminopeptidase P/Spt16, N-terminal [Phytophthora cactorum]|nr:Creatinase/Aminopeptidase P/Spt16, N-terminal [Phytophthora cactorum]